MQLPLGTTATSGATSLYNKENPFTATVLANQQITGRDSAKVVQHIELDLSDSGLSYQPGDALGVWPVNNAQLVKVIVLVIGGLLVFMVILWIYSKLTLNNANCSDSFRGIHQTADLGVFNM